MSTPTSVTTPGVRDNFDAGSLSWVMGEIREALTKSKSALKEALEQDTDAQVTALRHAKSYLHQADGALQIVDIDGVAIITETTEDIFERIEAGQITLSTSVVEAVENAYEALVEYLDELLTGGAHQPVRLFPYYRALLELRSAERIHPADLFFPNLAVRPTLPAPLNPDVAVDYAQLRKRFELALLPFLKQSDSATSPAAAGLQSIIGDIEQAEHNPQSRAFWWVLHGFSEAVVSGQIPAERYVKQLFARINLQIRRLSEGSHSIAERLLRDALFFVARIAKPSPLALQIQQNYYLQGLVPIDYVSRRYGRVDAEILAQAKDKLVQAKTLWNRIASGDASVAESYETEMRYLMESGSRLGSDALAKLLRELNGIARHAAHSGPGDRLGLEMATSLLFVENALNNIGHLDETFAARADALTARLLSIVAGEEPKEDAEWLDDMSRHAQQRQTLGVIASEMQASLRQVEKTLEEFFREPADRSSLPAICPVLHQIGGALAVLDQDDAMLAVQHTQAAVQAFIDAPAHVTPAATSFQAVAQNIGALSFFIETLQLHPDTVHERFHFDQAHGIFRANLIAKKPAPEQAIPRDAVPPVDTAHELAQAKIPAGSGANFSAPSSTDTLVNQAANSHLDLSTPTANVPHANAASSHFAGAVLPTVEDELRFHQQQSADLAQSLHEEPGNAALQEQLRASLQQIQRDAKLLDDQDASDHAKAAIALLAPPDATTSTASLAEIVSNTSNASSASSAAHAAHIAGTTVAAAPLAQPVAVVDSQSDAEVDAELLEIFLMEADEVLETVRRSIPESRGDPHNPSPMTTLRRSFHTLKGSGRMVGLNALGEAAWSIEQALNARLSEGTGGSANLYALLDEATNTLTHWVADLQQTGRSDRTPQALVAAADRVMQGEPFTLIATPIVIENDAPIPALDATRTDEFLVAAANAASATPTIPVTAVIVEHHIPTHALEPAATLLVPTHIEVASPDATVEEPHDAVLSGRDTLFSPIDLAVPAADFSSQVSPPPADSMPAVVLLDTTIADVPSFETSGSAEVLNFPGLSSSNTRLDDNVKRIGELEISLPLHNIYLAETDQLVRLLALDLSEWRHEPERPVSIQAVHASHSLAGSSATVGFTAMQGVAHALENIYQLLARKAVPLVPADYDVLEQCVGLLKSMMKEFSLGDLPLHEPAQINTLVAFLKDIDRRSMVIAAPDPVVESVATIVPPTTRSAERQASIPMVQSAPPTMAANETYDVIKGVNNEVSAEVNTAVSAELPTSAILHIDSSATAKIDTASNDPAPAAERLVAFAPPTAAKPAELNPELTVAIKDELDADLLPIFIEEGRDMLPQMSEALRAWQKNPSSASLPQSVLRLLHTIKGSARMAGAMNLGQFMHETETRIEQMLRHGAPTDVALDELMTRHDHGLYLFELLQNPAAAASANTFAVTYARNDMAATAATNPAVSSSARPGAGVVIQDRRARNRTDGEFVPAHGAATAVGATANSAAGAVALVRVRADILDRLVNQAGEVSISRSKLETEVGTLRQSLGELTDNVARLRQQLREIEMQAETQITSKMANSPDREFDPLEFDRFTRLQELTRMMAESVSDVASVQQNLARTVDGATVDLALQARLTRDLQQDLMRVRMVQFASISERLYRVTRQASKELDKRVTLDIIGSSVEIDRSVLEKMAGPFEHLLRNAIVHGIESREQRRSVGKSETGELRVEIRQEGNEVVLQFSDDGCGLDLQRIRSKAKAIGLLASDRDITEGELTDLIFNPGFTTAHEVTELAGRGVGMDVVRSEATALGGRVSIVSQAGKGAQFTIHLPLTLAVTQVVVLRTGNKTYAVPSVLVEQVQQLKANALASAYNDGIVIWQGHRVPLFYLPALLGESETIPVAQQYSPLIILKSGTDRVALHVDEILGNREVVVKNIGPQLARMIGIAGATVLGSGEIVLILNPVPLAQRAVNEQARANVVQSGAENGAVGAVAEMDSAKPSLPATEAVQGLRTQHIVMVVDDSLTVRRVTQRLLTREGYQVVLAKDGVDALQQLQAITPDVMLVDIEMPRMDGFDLTRNVRGDERTASIPIIMITSRTAEKHRNYAMELGVNEYLGKPFQEDALVKTIAGFIQAKLALQ